MQVVILFLTTQLNECVCRGVFDSQVEGNIEIKFVCLDFLAWLSRLLFAIPVATAATVARTIKLRKELRSIKKMKESHP